MVKELISLHGEILSEFENRLEANENIPEIVVEELQSAENLGLDSRETVRTAIEAGVPDETE